MLKKQQKNDENMDKKFYISKKGLFLPPIYFMHIRCESHVYESYYMNYILNYIMNYILNYIMHFKKIGGKR